MIKHVLTDFFGVLASEVAPVWLPRYMDKEAAIAYKRDVINRVDLGEFSYRELLGYLSDLTGVAPEQIHKEWYAISKPHVEYISLLRGLKECDVYLLSNASSEFVRCLIDKHGLMDLFAEVFISAEIRLAKPDAAYFRYCLDKIGAKAEECVFIDDNPVNVEAAKKVGITAILFENSAQIRREFEVLGIS